MSRDKARTRLERCRAAGEETPHGFITVNKELEIVGWGETVEEALQDARAWACEDSSNCPWCGRNAAEHSWRVYQCDAWVLDVWYGTHDVSLLIDGWIKWAAEVDPPRFVEAEDAWCVHCRNEYEARTDCPACDEGRIEREGIEPDGQLPPIESAAWIGERAG